MGKRKTNSKRNTIKVKRMGLYGEMPVYKFGEYSVIRFYDISCGEFKLILR